MDAASMKTEHPFSAGIDRWAYALPFRLFQLRGDFTPDVKQGLDNRNHLIEKNKYLANEGFD